MHCRLLARLRPSRYQAPSSPVHPGLLKPHQLVHIAHLLQQSHENCTADFGDCGRAADFGDSGRAADFGDCGEQQTKISAASCACAPPHTCFPNRERMLLPHWQSWQVFVGIYPIYKNGHIMQGPPVIIKLLIIWKSAPPPLHKKSCSYSPYPRLIFIGPRFDHSLPISNSLTHSLRTLLKIE